MPISQDIENKTFAHTDFDFEKLPKLVRDNIPKIKKEIKIVGLAKELCLFQSSKM